MKPLERFAKTTLVVLGLLTQLTIAATQTAANAGALDPPKRIISLAPSTTEILFKLGLGDKLVGVTRYCDFPTVAKSITKVGGFLDPNYEEIIALKPNLVILVESHRDAKRELDKLRVRTLTIPHKTLDDIHRAIRLIGDACGAIDQAKLLLKRLESRVETVQGTVKDRAKPRVLICIGRDTESGRLASVYAAGRSGFYDEIIEAAGGVNAYTDESVSYPQLSAESVIGLNPDVIVDLVSHIKPGGKAVEITRQWDSISVVDAVHNDQVHVIVGLYSLRPGPRYVQFLEGLARLLHPEAFGKPPPND